MTDGPDPQPADPAHPGGAAQARQATHPAAQLHRQLMEDCPACRRQWELLDRERERFLEMLRGASSPNGAGPGTAAPDGEPDHHRTTWSWEARRLEDRLRRLRRRRTAAVRQTRELLDQGPGGRRQTLDRSHRRFRSRLLAERLLDRGREALADDPREAADLFALVPRVVAAIAGSEDRPWAAELAVRAAGGRAEALRRAGDPAAADRVFAALRRELGCRPVEDPAVHAELAHLEAKLRTDQDRQQEASRLLDTAAVLFLHAGLPEHTALAHLDHARLLRRSRPEEARVRLRSARRALGPPPPDAGVDNDADTGAHTDAGAGPPPPFPAPRLPLALACLELAVLCDLGRLEEARRHRDRHRHLLESSGDPDAAAFADWLGRRLGTEAGNGRAAPDDPPPPPSPPLPEAGSPLRPAGSEDA